MAALIRRGLRSIPRFSNDFSLTKICKLNFKNDKLGKNARFLDYLQNIPEGEVTDWRQQLREGADFNQTEIYRVKVLSKFRSVTGSLPCCKSSQNHNRLIHSRCYQSTVRCFHTSSPSYDEVKTMNTPTFAESITEGDIRWQKAVGDYVEVDEVVAEIETDKTSIPVPSPVAGIIEEFLVEDGDKVEGNQPVYKIKLTGDAPPPKAEATPQKEPAAPLPEEKPMPPPSDAKPEPPASTAGPIPTQPPPSTPVPKAPMSSTPVSSLKPTPAPVSAPDSAVKGSRGETRTKMNRMRKRIAQRLKDAQNTCAMLTTFNEVDMSNLMEMRKLYKDAFLKKHNLKLGFMSAFVKASAYALEDQPVVNAYIDDSEIVYRDYKDISVAVATPKGLVVPVIRNVETMNYADIERRIMELGEKARNNALAIEDMDGGTFTISNGGVFGSMLGTPIINPPQSAILGMHAIKDRAVVINGKVEVRPMMYVALTYDHRLIDGREAVTFLVKIKQAVEDPRVLLLDL